MLCYFMHQIKSVHKNKSATFVYTAPHDCMNTLLTCPPVLVFTVTPSIPYIASHPHRHRMHVTSTLWMTRECSTVQIRHSQEAHNWITHYSTTSVDMSTGVKHRRGRGYCEGSSSLADLVENTYVKGTQDTLKLDSCPYVNNQWLHVYNRKSCANYIMSKTHPPVYMHDL